MKRQIILIAVIAATVASCGRFGKKQDAQEHKERIVCVAKEYNEVIFELGAQQDIVGVDISSNFPESVKGVTTVGYHRALSAEAILACKPTLIIHDNNIGPQPVVDQLKGLNIPMKTFADHVQTIDQTKGMIREIAAYFKKEKQADSLCTMLDQDLAEATKAATRYTDSPRVAIIHFGQANNVYLTMTRNNVAAEIIRMSGGIVTVDGERGMVPLSPEVIAKSDPDVILLTDVGFDRLGTLEKIKELPGVAQTKAAKNNRIFRVEEHDMVYLGPRTGKNILKFQKLIHAAAAQ